MRNSGKTTRFEYIQVKYEFFGPAMAAETLLHAAAAKRREVLQKTMDFIIQTIQTSSLDTSPVP